MYNSYFGILALLKRKSRHRRLGLSKSLAEFAAVAAKKLRSFSAAACTWQKILYGLPQPFVEKPQRVFDSLSRHRRLVKC